MAAADPGSIVAQYVSDVLGGAAPGSARDLVGADAVRRQAAGFRTAFPDATVAVDRLVAAGELCAVHLRGRGTHLGVFQGCPPTGRDWAATCTAIYRVEAGRIADAWINWDWLAVLEQLGCIHRVETVSA